MAGADTSLKARVETAAAVVALLAALGGLASRGLSAAAYSHPFGYSLSFFCWDFVALCVAVWTWRTWRTQVGELGRWLARIAFGLRMLGGRQRLWHGLLLSALVVVLALCSVEAGSVFVHRMRHYRYFSQDWAGIKAYVEAVGEHRKGHLRQAAHLYRSAERVVPASFLAVEAQQQARLLEERQEIVLAGYQRSRRLKESEGQFLYYYWELADAMALDPNFAYAKELLGAHQELERRITAIAAAVRDLDCRQRLPVLVADEGYSSVLGRALWTGLAWPQPNPSLLDHVCRQDPTLVQRNLEERSRWNAVAEMLESVRLPY